MVKILSKWEDVHYNSQTDEIIFSGNKKRVKLVCFDDPKILGWCQVNEGVIGINKKLIYQVKHKVVIDVLEHELIHFLVGLKYREIRVQSHGEEFKDLCRRYNVEPKAKLNIQKKQEEYVGDLEGDRVVIRVKKLLKLAGSGNPHEAALAMAKANSLLLKYNLSNIEHDDEEEFYFKETLKFSRIDTKYRVIAGIVRSFGVYPVFNKKGRETSLEISGSKASVEVADYIISYLDLELDKMWKKEKKERGLKGLRVKNSFFRGVQEGFVSKKKDQIKLSEEDSRELVKMEEDLRGKVKIIYKSLRSSSSGQRLDSDSYNLGKQRGNSLSINPSLKSNKKEPKKITS